MVRLRRPSNLEDKASNSLPFPSTLVSASPAQKMSSGIGIANLPNQRHRIVAKRGAHFTIMVVGESGLGKTTLINTLFATELSPPKNYSRRHVKQLDKLTEVEIIKAELEEKSFKVKLTVIDTPGFGDYVNNRIRIYVPPVDPEDDEASIEHARALADVMPHAIIGSTDDVVTKDGRTVKGREYLWGVAEVENENHCDFRKLRSLLIRTHMLDLINTTEEHHYENYRLEQMETRKFGEARVKKPDNPKFKEEEEALRKRFTEQVKAEEARFRQWEQHLIAERDRLNKDLEIAHGSIKSLEAELDNLQIGYRGSQRTR
ncbi:hypothetical protein FRB91_005536 [Serendipita sp. 411]|nr:hypothetical protein FRB91_005536 [Serendipita sp. 411]